MRYSYHLIPTPIIPQMFLLESLLFRTAEDVLFFYDLVLIYCVHMVFFLFLKLITLRL